MNVTVFHYFLSSFERTRLPAYCLKPTPCNCSVGKSVFQPLICSGILSAAFPFYPVQGKTHRQRNAACNQNFILKLFAFARFPKLPLRSRSLQSAHFTSCKYACFYWDTQVSVGEEENMSAWELEIQVGLFFFLVCCLLWDFNSETDARVFLSSLGVGHPQTLAGLRFYISVSHL